MRHRPANISEQNLQNLTSSDINTRFRDGRDNDQCNFHISHRRHVCNFYLTGYISHKLRSYIRVCLLTQFNIPSAKGAIQRLPS
jgi:hypothetical protein